MNQQRNSGDEKSVRDSSCYRSSVAHPDTTYRRSQTGASALNHHAPTAQRQPAAHIIDLETTVHPAGSAATAAPRPIAATTVSSGNGWTKASDDDRYVESQP
jgi:hypothetical protein